MWFQTTEVADGSIKTVVWPAPILKLDQLMSVLAVVWIVNCGPWMVKVADPCVTTGWEGLAKAGGGANGSAKSRAARSQRPRPLLEACFENNLLMFVSFARPLGYALA